MSRAACPSPNCRGQPWFSTNGSGETVERCVCGFEGRPRATAEPLESTPDRHKQKRNGHRDRLKALAKKGIVPEPKPRMVMPLAGFFVKRAHGPGITVGNNYPNSQQKPR